MTPVAHPAQARRPGGESQARAPHRPLTVGADVFGATQPSDKIGARRGPNQVNHRVAWESRCECSSIPKIRLHVHVSLLERLCHGTPFCSGSRCSVIARSSGFCLRGLDD